MTLHNFISMGGYAPYVWSAYSITAFVFAWNSVVGILERKKVHTHVQHYLAKRHYS